MITAVVCLQNLCVHTSHTFAWHMALCHTTKLANQSFHRTMAVTNNVQLSTDFDGFYLAKETLIFALSP